MIQLTDEMKELLYSALADGYTPLVGTASKDGWPQISPKGSVMVYDSETLAYWERSKRSAMDNLAENPKVVIYYNNQATRTRWRFYGTATIHESGAIRDDVMSKTIQAELDRDPELKGVAVLVKVEKVGELSGNILQQRD
ncbi:MAG: pyridoxamine 5'-phosphate oxidase family protein [Chloroflexi bacterium]|nr:pyridoxamine 5'-phosphate oxidase family protein [Chloroflexota bacterium]